VLRLIIASALFLMASPAIAEQPPQSQAAADGTDPAWVQRSAKLAYERTEAAPGFTVNSFLVEAGIPLGNRTLLRAALPIVANGVRGNNSLGLGDALVSVVHRVHRGPKDAVILNAGVVVDSASRRELGAGSTVARFGGGYVRYLPGGHIVAPVVEQSVSIDGESDVNVTTLLLIGVPRLQSRRWFMTVDPLLTLDWSNDTQAGGLAGSLGYRLGPMLGGRAQLVLRPVVGLGPDRAIDWNVRLSFQLLDF
jgi:hypothetical protein